MYDGSQRTASPPTSASRQFVCQSGVWYCRTPTPRSTGTRPMGRGRYQGEFVHGPGPDGIRPLESGRAAQHCLPVVRLRRHAGLVRVRAGHPGDAPARRVRGPRRRAPHPDLPAQRDLPATFFVPGHWMHEHEDGGLLTVCMHPQVIGRGHRMAMLGRFVDHCRDAGATFARMGDVARALDGRSET